MHSDSIYLIGDLHLVCQDYALTKDNYTHLDRPESFAIISDGCSSCADVDVGARIATCVLAKTLSASRYDDYYNPFNISNLSYEIVGKLIELGFSREAANASLVYAFTCGKYIHAEAIGDGFVIVKYKNGNIKAVKLDYTENTPLYPSYFSNESWEKYFLCVPQKLVITLYYINDGEKTVETQDAIAAKFDFRQLGFPAKREDIEFVLVASDGLGTFYKQENGDTVLYNTIELIRKICDIKSTMGKFVQRKVRKVIAELAKDGYKHYDDISVAGIYLG